MPFSVSTRASMSSAFPSAEHHHHSFSEKLTTTYLESPKPISHFVHRDPAKHELKAQTHFPLTLQFGSSLSNSCERPSGNPTHTSALHVRKDRRLILPLRGPAMRRKRRVSCEYHSEGWERKLPRVDAKGVVVGQVASLEKVGIMSKRTETIVS